ncbi:hypothetical protein [Asanoa sp. NPDC050611]|uniref:hypothetical protein n=1 Tax=Asanoa sp. NPDC050611 TaxID=3157098 RepID=UPI0033EFC4BE
MRDGAKVGGAHGPVENDEMSRPDAADTTGSQADEQPARQEARTRDHDEGVGPAHEPGARRGEQQRR